ncbi:MAG: SRPBCC family protein [Planctomycetota bacterium]|nr:MAG: SRPBCC family protein [Planctomycetota bacterium]
MPTLVFQTTIQAPIDRCFDLARSIDFHVHSMARTGEVAIAGTTSGLIGEGEEVTWRARHFGVTQRLTSRVVECRRPEVFVDEQVRGAFHSFRHEHRFVAIDAGATSLTDTFTFRVPCGVLGRVVEVLVLRRYMHRVLTLHLANLKRALESDGWRRFLEAGEA